MPAAFLDRLASLIGAQHIVTDAQDMEPYLVERRGLYHGKALAIARPANTAEVAAVVALCHETDTAVVPQGGNTGLVGGQIPDTSGRQLILSLARLREVREVDLASNTMVVEAGMTLAEVQQAAEKAGRLFPLSLASEGSCTIGGNLATNAGGTAVIAYGNTRELVLGVEAVLSDGRVLSSLSKLKKDNTGYDLKDLFVGSEGTLGVITAAVLKLFPRPQSIETAFVGLADPHHALKLLQLAHEEAGNAIHTFELIPRIGIEYVLRHVASARDPLTEPHKWYVLLELTAQRRDGVADTMNAVLEAALEQGIIEDAALAASLDQAKQFWALREDMSEVQRLEGGSIKHDVSVPIASVPDFIDEASAAVLKAVPGGRLVPFGHLGDGNIHFNLSQPVGADKQAFVARWYEINAIVHGVVARYHGSISAEHGIGQLKRDLLPAVKDPTALDVMRAIKKALDPKGIMNPGKVL
ncbi:FAD-binding oxidoreductase [Methylovirgula sp. 4M-Z18]|uniref:FAD-binding oxidoreductase n=1 Tax=Methylovirgula sp. 4M-Z18 TaxID=2293567 RepID=UPI000E2F02E4|nr:FAD-binding oxidoreductase [Methylovirgula sp. 4M-Z18]RFB80094.1 FAD-binding oxidoreductase [Methylovirgula sp. 4M-Z18]